MTVTSQAPTLTAPGPVTPPPASDYPRCRARVDAAHQWMRTVVAGRHTPAEARTAAAELTVALCEATATATQALTSADPTPPRRGRICHRKAVRTVPPVTARWSAELVRLSQIAVWLRRTTLDDLGVHIPTTVRVDNYAAVGPHIAGMGFGADTVRAPGESRIGVDLPSIIDAGRPPAAQPPPSAPVFPAPVSARAA